jgi:hypothetical protein
MIGRNDKTAAVVDNLESFLIRTIVDVLACHSYSSLDMVSVVPMESSENRESVQTFLTGSFFARYDPYISTLSQIQAVKHNNLPHATLWQRKSLVSHRPVRDAGNGSIELGPPIEVTLSRSIVPLLDSFRKASSPFPRDQKMVTSREKKLAENLKRSREAAFEKIGKNTMLYVFVSKDGYWSVVGTPGMIPFEKFERYNDFSGHTMMVLREGVGIAPFEHLKGDKLYGWIQAHPPWKLMSQSPYSTENDKKTTMDLIRKLENGKKTVGGSTWKDLLPLLEEEKSAEKEKAPKTMLRKADQDFPSLKATVPDKPIQNRKSGAVGAETLQKSFRNKKKRRLASFLMTSASFAVEMAKNETYREKIEDEKEERRVSGDTTVVPDLKTSIVPFKRCYCHHCGKYGHYKNKCWNLKK